MATTFTRDEHLVPNKPVVFVIKLLHAGSAAAIVLGLLWLFVWHPPGWGLGWSLAAWAVVPNILMYVWTGFGVTIGYHRLFTHRSFKCKPWLEASLAVGGAQSLEGDPINWSDLHRTHHANTDLEADPHSPYKYGYWQPPTTASPRWERTLWRAITWVVRRPRFQKQGMSVDTLPTPRGFWWSHQFWMLYKYELPANSPGVKDLEKRWYLRFIRDHYLPFAVATFALPTLIAGIFGGWAAGTACFLVAILRVLMLLHATWSINSITHIWGAHAVDDAKGVYRADDSRNTKWLWLASLGENWHSNHHARANWAYHRQQKGEKDLAGRLIKIFERLGWVWDVKKQGDAPLVFADAQKIPWSLPAAADSSSRAA